MRRITVEQLVEKMARMPEELEAATVSALRKGAVQVHKTAVQKFGKYQSQSGPFNAWALLSINTVNQKMDYGGASGPNPLIGSYGPWKNNLVYPVPLRQSLAMEVDEHNLSFQVGTNDPIGKWQEYGTPHIPPRPFLRPALYENEEWIKEMLTLTVGAALMEGTSL